jgi:hypothetical protein
LCVFSPKTTISPKNKPKTNPIKPNFIAKIKQFNLRKSCYPVKKYSVTCPVESASEKEDRIYFKEYRKKYPFKSADRKYRRLFPSACRNRP